LFPAKLLLSLGKSCCALCMLQQRRQQRPAACSPSSVVLMCVACLCNRDSCRPQHACKVCQSAASARQGQHRMPQTVVCCVCSELTAGDQCRREEPDMNAAAIRGHGQCLSRFLVTESKRLSATNWCACSTGIQLQWTDKAAVTLINKRTLDETHASLNIINGLCPLLRLLSGTQDCSVL